MKNTVTVFTTPNCVACRQTKKTFDRLGVVYDSIDLSLHPEQAEIFREAGLLQAPIVVAGDRRWSGFRLEKIQAVAREFAAEGSKDEG